MTPIAAKAKRVGGSLMVTVPKAIVDLLGLEEGEVIEFTVRRSRQSYLGALRGIGSFTEADRADHE